MNIVYTSTNLEGSNPRFRFACLNSSLKKLHVLYSLPLLLPYFNTSEKIYLYVCRPNDLDYLFQLHKNQTVHGSYIN
jgi:hypothetical protein